MTTFDYSKSAATALRILKRFGAPVMLRTSATVSYDTSKGVASAQTADHPGTGVKLNYEQRDIDETLIKQGDMQVYLATTQQDGSPMPQPRAGDKMLFGAETWNVVQAKAIDPAGVPVLFIVQVRR